MDHAELKKLVDEEVAAADQPFFIISGYFLAWFSLVELNLTAILAFLSRSQDLSVFEILTKGMDARVKLERLRQLAKVQHKIGPNLADRLKVFETRIIPLRNRLSHASPWINEREVGVFHLISISQFAGPVWDADALNDAPSKLQATELLEHGRWLRMFCGDLQQVVLKASLERLEIDAPLSPLPKELHSDRRQSTGRANPSKPPQKK